jgi:hypothetical protein
MMSSEGDMIQQELRRGNQVEHDSPPKLQKRLHVSVYIAETTADSLTYLSCNT